MKKLIKICLLFIMAVGVYFISFTSTYAAEIVIYDDVYEDISMNFLKAQYSERNITFDSLDIYSSKNMYNYNNEVVGKIVIVNRDSQKDYVVFNCTTSQIDEFSFNCDNVEEKFSSDVYYTGVLNYYKKENDGYRSLEDNSVITNNKFKEKSNNINRWLSEYKKKASRTLFCDGNPLPNPNKDGWNGFYSWSNIRTFNNNNGYSNSDWNYLSGIYCGGITDSNLKFYDQNTFNSYFGTDNACGPTALTNMFSWFQYRGYKNKNGVVNALKNNSEYDTFDRFRKLVNHSNSGGTSRSKYTSAMYNYAKEQGYDSIFSLGIIDTFSEYKKLIDANIPILTSISLDKWGGHAVLCVGYEEFEMEYEEKHSFLWWDWKTTEHKYSKYLRIIDGWETSNSSRFIDMSGYWDDIEGRWFNLDD